MKQGPELHLPGLADPPLKIASALRGGVCSAVRLSKAHVDTKVQVPCIKDNLWRMQLCTIIFHNTQSPP